MNSPGMKPGRKIESNCRTQRGFNPLSGLFYIADHLSQILSGAIQIKPLLGVYCNNKKVMKVLSSKDFSMKYLKIRLTRMRTCGMKMTSGPVEWQYGAIIKNQM